jgi:hypothetical protein
MRNSDADLVEMRSTPITSQEYSIDPKQRRGFDFRSMLFDAKQRVDITYTKKYRMVYMF